MIEIKLKRGAKFVGLKKLCYMLVDKSLSLDMQSFVMLITYESFLDQAKSGRIHINKRSLVKIRSLVAYLNGHIRILFC